MMPRYKYANSILWGPTYDERSGMHIIEAADDAAAFAAANRADKDDMGHSFLFRFEEENECWVNCSEQPYIRSMLTDEQKIERLELALRTERDYLRCCEARTGDELRIANHINLYLQTADSDSKLRFANILLGEKA
jgi:hypothetical protein